jgi:hypothetical protein
MSPGTLLDYLVGAGENRWRHGEAERVRGLEVDDKLEFGRLINRDVARVGPVEDLVHVIRDTAYEIREFASIRHQPPS